MPDVGVASDTLDEALWTARLPLVGEWEASPASYLFFYVGSLPLYAPFTSAGAIGTWPIYVGSTPDLRDRMSRHRRTLRAALDITVDDLVVAALPRPSLAHARVAEQSVVLQRQSLQLVTDPARASAVGFIRHQDGRHHCRGVNMRATSSLRHAAVAWNVTFN